VNDRPRTRPSPPPAHHVTERYTSKYLDLELGPEFAFGHGSGYTTFRHANARLSADCLQLAALENGEQVEVSVDVSNTGSRDGDEVVQLYVRDLISSVAQPVRRLVAFARRHIGAGQTITVSFKLGPEQLGFWDTEASPARFVVEPGTFGLYIGASLQGTCELTFEVVLPGAARMASWHPAITRRLAMTQHPPWRRRETGPGRRRRGPGSCGPTTRPWPGWVPRTRRGFAGPSGRSTG
jgi:Fibronectin type III-like domain